MKPNIGDLVFYNNEEIGVVRAYIGNKIRVLSVCGYDLEYTNIEPKDFKDYEFKESAWTYGTSFDLYKNNFVNA